MYHPEQTHIVPLATIAHERVLPVEGEVLARYNSVVAASDTVAAAEILSDRVIVEVAEAVGVPSDEVDDVLVVRVGDEVKRGQLLAKRRRLFGSRVVRAPMGGFVTAIEGGRLVLEGAPEVIELKAAMPGTITAVMERRGVQIQTVGSLVQGAWGTGGVTTGALQVFGAEFEAGDELPAGMITMDQRGAILLTHLPLNAEVLAKADEQRVRGLIAPAMRAALIEPARLLDGVSVVLTEGFGQRAMTREIYELLSAHRGREVVLIANEPSRWGADRPEIIVPVDFPGETPTALQVGQPVDVGSRVRLLRDPYAGQIGAVSALPEEPQPVENGLKVRGAYVNLGGRREVFVPLANLALIG